MAKNRSEEMRLLQALRASRGLALLGCHFERGLTGGVAVAVRNRALGLWWHADGGYQFALSVQARPEHAGKTLDEAVSITAERATLDKLVSAARL